MGDSQSGWGASQQHGLVTVSTQISVYGDGHLISSSFLGNTDCMLSTVQLVRLGWFGEVLPCGFTLGMGLCNVTL